MSRVVCLHEDRADHAIGLQLAIASLARHAPALTVLVHCPRLEGTLRGWIEGRPNARVIRLEGVESMGWNVKPGVLHGLLDRYDDVMWMDSDILLTGPVDRLFESLPDDLMLATEETLWGQQQGGDVRTRGWGLRAARVFPATVNTGIVRVTRRHRRLLRAWQAMLEHPKYLQAQARPWYERPIHMVGDQEVLTALLGASEFADVPVRRLKRGRGIAQCFGPAGFTPSERLRSLARGLPPLVHAMGPKPWLRLEHGRMGGGFSEAAIAWYRALGSELSPYTLAARRYLDVQGIDLDWTVSRSLTGAALAAFAGSHAAMAGFPLAVFDHLARSARRAIGVASYVDRTEFAVHEHPFPSLGP